MSEPPPPAPRYVSGQCVMTRWGMHVYIDGAPWYEKGTWVYSYDYNLGLSEGRAAEHQLCADSVPAWLVLPSVPEVEVTGSEPSVP